MTFREILGAIIDPTPGAIAGAIMGADGISLEEYRKTSGLDLNTVAVEFQRVLAEARKVTGALSEAEDASLEELILCTTEHQILFRQVDEEYCVVVALARDGMLGKARYLLRSLLDKLRQEL